MHGRSILFILVYHLLSKSPFHNSDCAVKNSVFSQKKCVDPYISEKLFFSIFLCFVATHRT